MGIRLPKISTSAFSDNVNKRLSNPDPKNFEIDVILEVNGPWHYRLGEVINNKHDLATPFKGDTITKCESYNKDVLKINHALKISNSVYIHWLDNNQTTEITKQIELL